MRRGLVSDLCRLAGMSRQNYYACRRHRLAHPELLTLILAIHPLFFYNATVTMDYVWALGMVLAGFDLLEQERFGWAGLALGLAVGFGMTPRLEVALVIAYYGLSTGIIGVDLYSVVVFMGLVTAIVSAPALKHVLKRGGYDLSGI